MGKNTLKPNQKGGQPIKINQTLIIKPPQRANIGIDRYKRAVSLADRGRRASLVELITELMDADPVLSEAWAKRVRAITNADIVFQVDGKEVEEMMDFIDTTAFEELLKEIMGTIGFGKTVGEYDFTNGFKFTNIDRRHLNTETKQILINQYDTNGISYEDNEWLLNIGKDNDLGLFVKLIPFAIFKRDGGSDYAQYTELYGIPQFVALYDPEDDNARQEMERTVEKRGSSGSMVMSKNSDVKTLGSEAGATNAIHKDFLKWCDEQILIGINGQTMTTKDGSSRSQSETHADTEDDINKSDRRWCQRVLNEIYLPVLEKRGYPVKGGWFSFPEKEKALTKKEQMEIAKEVDDRTEEGVDNDWWFENFALPKGNGKKKPEAKQDNEDIEDENPKNERRSSQVKKAQTLKVSDRSFWQKLNDFFANAPR